jgi:prepilin-type N-terminal cleavage/methylation domain-containing protein
VSVLRKESGLLVTRPQRDSGFTLMEILVIIVVLAILSAVVIYAVGGVTSKSARAACADDGDTVSSAISDINNEHPGVFVTTAATNGGVAAENLLLGSNYDGPYIQSWPNNSPHYAFSISSTGELLVAIGVNGTLGTPSPYGGPSSCPSTMS